MQQFIRMSHVTPPPALAPASHPAGVTLESEQENPGSSRPKASDPDSPETHPTPRSTSPDAPSKPLMTPTKPGAMEPKTPSGTPSKTPVATPSKTPSAMPTKPPATPLTSSDPPLGPPAMPRKHTLTPQKAVSGSSGDSAKDILDRVTARYGAGMSPQYSNVLALLTSGKSSQVAASKRPDPDAPAGGGHTDHPYIKPARIDSDSNHKKVEPPNKKAKRDPGSGPEVADAGSCGSKKSSKKTSKKIPKSKKTVMSDSDSSESEHLCGKLCSQPMKEEIKKHQCWRAEKWASNLPSLQSYQQQKGIILDNLPPNDFRDHSDYIQQVLHNNESTGLSIHHISDLLKHYSKDHSSTGRKRYDTLKTLLGATLGKGGASPLFVMEVFMAPVTKEIIMPDNINGYYSQIMMGLAGLFAHDAICKITSDTGNEKTFSECYCPCASVYLVGNHMTMNNHICYHLWLVLVCRLKHCFYIDTQAEGMWKHIKDKHNIARGKSATGKK